MTKKQEHILGELAFGAALFFHAAILLILLALVNA